jgi:hypothetical protein
MFSALERENWWQNKFFIKVYSQRIAYIFMDFGDMLLPVGLWICRRL